jgi:hypothetical protein
MTRVQPNKMYFEMSMGGNVMQKTSFDGEKGMRSGMGQEQAIEGKDAYGVEVKLPSGKTTMRFYDVESGLYVREVKTVEGPQGNMSMATDYGDYKSYNGVMFPTLIKQPINAQMKMELVVTDVVVNGEIPADLFKQ